MGLRFGLDIGIASVGWAVVRDDYEVLEAGANLFDAADASKNVERRGFRQLKRFHRRRTVRGKDFDKLWQAQNLKIPNQGCNNQLELRVKGLKEELSQEQIYHVLKNMLLHRGISYLEDALDESASAKSDYAKGLLANQQELEIHTYPCEIQLARLQKYGKYRGDAMVYQDGEKIALSNVFTVGAYRQEIHKLLETQQKFHSFIDDAFIEGYLEIFSRKREYYVGPGNEKSRTDYGKYTTRWNPETGEYITEDNIFEKLIGRCSVYPEKMRAAGASYTAQEFNILNDLNNIKVNERKLTEEEKREIIDAVKRAKAVNMRKLIKTAIGEDIVTMTGARVDKNEKEQFHHFEQYNLFRKKLEEQGLQIDRFSREELDKIGNILTLNTEKESILSAFEREALNLSEAERECFIRIRKQNGSQFNKWQSFSLDIMQELIPQMYEEPKNQMEILTEMGAFQGKRERFNECTAIPKELVTEEIYNPVVRRSIRVTVDVVNALIKKYGYPEQIVIEMPRDRNDDERKKRISDAQRRMENELKEVVKKIREEYGVTITDETFRNHKQLKLKLKLWNEQDGKCLYSGRTISIPDLLENPNLFEVDHIIPRSISFDDSRANKVLVYRSENQDKRNLTPYMQLEGAAGDWTFDEMMSYVLNLKDRGKITKKKVDNLLYREDITKIEVLKGFISRNINDTRYASRVVLNTLQEYFRAKDADTKVKVVRGSFTHQMRDALRLAKDREETYAHHAVDAMLICFSQMGYEAYRELQSEFIDFEQEQVLDKEAAREKLNDAAYEEIMYQQKWFQIKTTIQAAEKKVKYWHKVDKKPNRGLCNQTIRGTRDVDGKTMKINKLDIYNPNGYKILKKMIDAGKSDAFLMYRHDRRTWEDMIRIMEEYADAANPFTAYEQETGDYLRKYAKKHNGPRIVSLKYLDGEVGSCIDISHKYGHGKNSRKVILESLNPYRTDVYYRPDEEKYYLVGIKYSDLKYQDGQYQINEEAYAEILRKEKMIADAQSRADLEGLGYEYRFSFYRNDMIEYEKDGERYVERFLSRTMPKQRNYIETKPVDAPKYPKQNLVGLGKTKHIRKICADILGNRYYCDREKFKLYVDRL